MEAEDPRNLQVYLRIRPPLLQGPGEPRLCLECGGPDHVRLVRPGVDRDGRRRELETFSGFTGIFPSTSGQEEVFEGIMPPLVRDLGRGKSSLLVAMGPTGAGKSYTVLGCDSHPGLLPRALQLLFNPAPADRADDEGTTSCEVAGEAAARSVTISMFEIYSEHATRGEKRRDLLEDTELTFLQSKVKEEVTSSAKEAIAVAMRGMQRRSTAATGANDQSSRSHCIVTLKVESNVSLIIADLAGSEREKQTGNQGVRLSESTFINNTSMVFGQCLRALLEHQKNPGRTLEKFYQNSLLTKYLKSYMEAKGRMALIVNVSPKEEDYFNTAFVLKQAAPFSEINLRRSSLAPPTSLKKRPQPTISRTWKRQCLPAPTRTSDKLPFEDAAPHPTPDPIHRMPSIDTKDISWRVLAKVPPKDRKSTGELTKVFSLQEMEEALDRQQVAHQQEISLAVAEALNDLERSHEIRFMEVQREHEHQVSELIRDHNDKIRELGKQYEDTRREREAKHEEIVKQLQKLHAVAAEVLQSQLQQALRAQEVSSRLQGCCHCHKDTNSEVRVAALSSSDVAHLAEEKTLLTEPLEAEATAGVAAVGVLTKIDEEEAEDSEGHGETSFVEIKETKEEVITLDDAAGTKQEKKKVVQEAGGHAREDEESEVSTVQEILAVITVKEEVESTGVARLETVQLYSDPEVRSDKEDTTNVPQAETVVDAAESTPKSQLIDEEALITCSSSSDRPSSAETTSARLSAAHVTRPTKEFARDRHDTTTHTPKASRVGQQSKIVSASPKDVLRKVATSQSPDCIGPLGYCLQELLGLSVREIENGLWHDVEPDAAKVSAVLLKHGRVLDVSDFSNHKLSLQKSLCIRYLFAVICKKSIVNKRLVELSNDCVRDRASLFSDIVRARTVGEAASFAKSGLRQDGLMKITGKADSADGEEDLYKTPAAKLRGPGNVSSKTVTRNTSSSLKTGGSLSSTRKAEGPLSSGAKAKGLPRTPEVIAGVESREKENPKSPKLSPAALPTRRWKLQPLSALNQRPMFQESKFCTGELGANNMWRGPGGSSTVTQRLTRQIRN